MPLPTSLLPDPLDQQRYQHLADQLEHAQQVELRDADQHPVTLTPALLTLLRTAVQELAAGHAVTLMATQQELSTHEAARLLGVSRPFLIDRLLSTGKLPFRMVGTHRRISLEAVIAYQQTRQVAQRAADALSAESQALGLY